VKIMRRGKAAGVPISQPNSSGLGESKRVYDELGTAASAVLQKQIYVMQTNTDIKTAFFAPYSMAG
jgi:hypothetical protein